MDLSEYRATALEKERTADLLRILPRGRTSVLDLGARDGHFSRLLPQYFPAVTALDLTMPVFAWERVTKVAGDATNLPFPDEAFDCVFCAEVLEHIPAVATACREMARVAKHEIVIGVPYRQDTRVGRTTCLTCAKHNSPWGHVHAFDEARLRTLFPALRVIRKSFVGVNREHANWLSTALMDWAGNPWGTYAQEEPCVHCGARLVPPPAERPVWRKMCSAAAARINRIQRAFVRPHGNWIHIVFSK
ncbi:MAG: class I SAM-dependent methyltransferase [Acidobacteria bacterium]|nr:class I SAM-dependent methyltransferase [Acidobacteriota bacterium]